MARMSADEQQRRAAWTMRFLEARGWTETDLITRSYMIEHGIAIDRVSRQRERTILRGLLFALETSGVVIRLGNKKYNWRIKEGVTYNPDAPLTSFTKATAPEAGGEPVPSGLEDRLAQLEGEIGALKQQLAGKPATYSIEVKGVVPSTVTVEDVTLPGYFNRVLSLAAMRMNVLLVGPAGCGKSFLAETVAKALDLPFASLSCTAGVNETHLTGRAIPNVSDGSTAFQGTDFLKCYETGGVFLLDEIDAADPNLLLVLNSGLANGYLNVPNRAKKARAVKHKNFIAIAAANTFGHGADRSYVGRNALDASTLDRFRIGTVACDYSPEVERALCPDTELLETCWRVRRGINRLNLRRIMSTRFIKDAAVMRGAGWTVAEVLEAYFQDWPAQERERVWSA